jgi:hypothetical protein
MHKPRSVQERANGGEDIQRHSVLKGAFRSHDALSSNLLVSRERPKNGPWA